MANRNQRVNQTLFKGLVKSFVTNAKINLGMEKNPLTGKKSKNLNQAKQQINMLEMLQTKTEGNLNENEQKFIDKKTSKLKKMYVQEKMEE
ncbi:MAG: DUF1844 domain-containing protein [Candidatus Marinimicrobia bacterium]|nr:DUF1844 domain-containing protein [Candidatus Neomarinimicrobiota bacterium]